MRRITEKCYVCGASHFKIHDVLTPKLKNDWELSDFQIDYVNDQQASVCVCCGQNLRSSVISKALLKHLGSLDVLNNLNFNLYTDLRILEINKCSVLTPYLEKFQGHVLVEYPEIDITAIDFDDNSFDVILHSDTLEHIDDFQKALSECFRVLDSNGVLIFTAPILIERLTRSRKEMVPSYHGGDSKEDGGYLVHHEFGVDVWTYVIQAGFDNVSIICNHYPGSIAFMSLKH